MNARAPNDRLRTSPPRGWLERTDRELVVLARNAGALRLAIGDGLRLLQTSGGYLELGFPSLGAYALERLGRKRHWAEDSARVARQLAELPATRDALARGEISWSTAEVLGRFATADTDAASLAEARHLTVRALRDKLRTPNPGVDPEPPLEPDEDDRHTLQITVDRVTAWAYELTRRFVHAMNGDPSDEAVVEALLAEGFETLLRRHPNLDAPDPAHDGCARLDAWRAQREALRRAAELAAESRLHGKDPDPELVAALADALADLDPAPAPRDPIALDAYLRDLNTQLQRRDRDLGEVARSAWDAGAWHHLGYASPAQYAHERLGLALASVKARVTLARRCAQLPELAVALEAGEIGFEAARLVARVADRPTVRAWLDRAGERTVKHLREEVEAVESIARANGDLRAAPAPPDDETLGGFIDLERAMLDGRVAALLASGGQMSGDGSSQMSGGPQSTPGLDARQPEETEESPASPLGRGVGRVALRLRLRADLVHFWRDVRRLFRQSGEPGDFADFLIRTFWHTWLFGDPGDRVAYQEIYERERFRCASPVCSNRDLTPHHLRFRSRGGGDAPDNLVGLCVVCHLELVHQGRMMARPPAGDILWTLGRTPLVVVAGRHARAA